MTTQNRQKTIAKKNKKYPDIGKNQLSLTTKGIKMYKIKCLPVIYISQVNAKSADHLFKYL